jgi:septum site-determining protein MinD
MGTVITVASGKGGTGKTSFCANVAVSLCALGEKVLLIDADAGLRSLDIVLGMTDRLLFTYGDVIEGRAGLKEAAVAHPVVRSLRVLTAPGAPKDYEPERYAALAARARAHFSFTLIDCSAGLGDSLLRFAAASDRAVVVSTPDQTALRSAQATALALAHAGQHECSIAVNRLRAGMIRRGDAATIDKAMDTSGLPLLGAVPEDERVIACGNRGEIMALSDFGPAAQAYLNIARRLQGRRVRLLQDVPGKY